MVRAALTRGAALVTAMLFAALAAAVVATLAASQSQWLRGVELRRDHAQAQAIVLAGLAWTREVLMQDALGGALDHLGEPWALPLPPTPLEGGLVDGAIVDAQGRVDVNHLAGTEPSARAQRERLARLFARAALDASALDERPREVPWLRAAEIAALPAIGEAGYARVAGAIVALPAAAGINVNTAPAEVLAAIVDGLDADALASLVAQRRQRPFASIADFRARLPDGARVVAGDAGLDVRSDFFVATVRARQGDAQVRGRALLRRRGRELPEVVWQTVE